MMWYISNTNNTWCDDGSINLKFKWKHSKSSHYHLRNVLLVSSWWLVLLSSNCVQTLDISDKPIYQPVNTFKWLFQTLFSFKLSIEKLYIHHKWLSFSGLLFWEIKKYWRVYRWIGRLLNFHSFFPLTTSFLFHYPYLRWSMLAALNQGTRNCLKIHSSLPLRYPGDKSVQCL